MIHKERSLYSQILVQQRGNILCLLFSVRRDQRNQTCMNLKKPKAMVFSYTKMSMATLLFTPDPKRILIVGLGGGTLPTALHELYPEAEIDSIEVDPAVVDVAERFFHFAPTPNNRVHVQDARVWVKRALRRDTRYDLVVLDAFNGEYIPEHLMTREFLAEVAELMTPEGTLASNTFSISDLYDHESATYDEVFDGFINFKVPESANRIVLVSRKKPTDDELKERAAELKSRLKVYDIPIERYARRIIIARDKKPDWRRDARSLTDQFSPANLLQGR